MSSSSFSLPDVGGVPALGDEALLELQRSLAGVRRRVDAASAVVAGEIARRSDWSLGMSGLAQKRGARTAERLVSQLTGMSGPESRAMVTVGEAAASPWLEAVTAGVTAGEVSVGAAAAIRTGLGEPGEGVDADALADAARRLSREAVALTPEKVAIRARQVRDDLDTAGVADREALLRSKRSLRLYPQADGTTKIIAICDPENAALVTDVFDRITSPRRGGVRFVDPADKQRAAGIEADLRATEQLAFDAFVQLLRMGSAIDDGTILGSKAAAVRVHVRVADLRAGEGAGIAEGQSISLSIGTVQRLICEGGTVPILFDDDGRAMNVGRTQRFHTPRQRIAIAARDGGCLITGCDRPPSWSEIHHIDEFDKHGGVTSTDDGVCLCRHHHMWVHDTGRRIVRQAGRYWLHTPGEELVELHSKNPLLQRTAG
jgi:hypothetical protein